MNTKQCPNCNENIPEDAAFCPVCFTVLKEASSPVFKKSHAGLIKTIIFIVAILLIALLVICGFVCCDEDSSNVTEKPTATAVPETTPEIIIENTQAPDFQQGLTQNNPLIPEISPTATPLPGLPGNPVSQGNTNNSSNIKPIATSNPGNNTVSPVLPTSKPVIPGNNNILPSFPTITLPTAAPTTRPTSVPTVRPTATAVPTNKPTVSPTTPTQAPTAKPTAAPTQAPTVDEALWSYSGNTITKYNGTETEVTIPETLGGNKIITIGEKAFYNNTSIKKVNILSNITNIGTSAFTGCSNLESVIMADSVTDTGTACFSGCSKLSSVKLSKNLKYLNENLFLYCYNLETIELPDSITKINYGALRHTNLKSLFIPAGVKNISTDIVAGAKNLSKIIVSTENQYYHSIDGVLFCNTYNALEKATLIAYPAGKKDKTYTIPDNVAYIISGAFSSNTYVESVTFSNDISAVGPFAFMNCTSLKLVYSNEKLTSISDNAFHGCANLETMYLSDNINSIATNAFNKCNKLVLDVKQDSYAHNFAISNGLSYKLVS